MTLSTGDLESCPKNHSNRDKPSPVVQISVSSLTSIYWMFSLSSFCLVLSSRSFVPSFRWLMKSSRVGSVGTRRTQKRWRKFFLHDQTDSLRSWRLTGKQRKQNEMIDDQFLKMSKKKKEKFSSLVTRNITFQRQWSGRRGFSRPWRRGFVIRSMNFELNCQMANLPCRRTTSEWW